jgi:hypothetical protein
MRRRRTLVGLGVLAVLAALPVAVLAARGNFHGPVEQQVARWTTNQATITDKKWHNLPALSLTRCTRNQVTETISVLVNGGPVNFRVLIDTITEAPMKPGAARFVPNGTEAFSFTFVGNTGPFEANDNHRFDLQWRSPSGATATLHRGAMNLLYRQGLEAC